MQNIQEENNRLRAQLEALVNAAHHQPSGTSSANARQDDGNFATSGLHDLNHVDGMAMIVEGHVGTSTRNTAGGELSQQRQTPPPSIPVAGKTTDVSLGFGIEGMDFDMLDGLRRQVEAARMEVAEIEARIALKRGASTGEDEVRSLAAAKTRTGTLAEEKEALLHVIETLKRERDEVDLERSVLERELSARRLLVAGTEDDVSSEKATTEEKKGKIGGEPGRDIGVERALMEVRSWLDNALTGWQKVSRIQNNLEASSIADCSAPDWNPATAGIRSGQSAESPR